MKRRTALGVVFLGLLVVACARTATVTLPIVPTTMVLPPETTRPSGPNHAFDEIPTVVGASVPTTTITLGTGTVTLSGTVTGPSGKIGGATVHIERLVGDQVATLDVTADAQGRYQAANIEAGLVRVRAWRTPDVAGTKNVAVFASGATTLDLSVTQYGGTDVQWAVAPQSPLQGQRVNLVVQLSTTAVGPKGLAAVEPLNGVGVRITPLGALQPPSIEERLTDADGRVLFTLTCNAVGSGDLDVLLATGEEARIKPPGCAAAPTTAPPTAATAPDAGPPTTAAPIPVDIPGSLVPVPVVPQSTTPQ